MRPHALLHPLFFAIYPVLWLYVANRTEVRLVDVFLPLLAAIALAASVLTAARLLLRNASRAALVSSLIVVAFFLFGRVVAAWGATDLPGDARIVVAAISGILVVALSSWIARTRRDLVPANHWAGVTALVLVGMVPVQAGIQWVRDARRPAHVTGANAPVPNRARSPEAQTARAAPQTPDIYYIVLDGYARGDVMRDIYGFDNAEFLAHLQRRGFQVSERSRANYCKTLHALASSLNMQYLHELMDAAPTSVDSRPLIRWVRSSRVVHQLREYGYSITAFASGYDLAEISKVDQYLEAGSTWSEFANVLLATTPVPWMLGEKGDLHARHRQRLKYILNRLPRIREASAPRFVFAHLLAPHPPFVLDRDGQSVPVSQPYGFYDGSDFMKHGGTVQEYVKGYAEQARWVTRQLEVALDALLERDADNPPIIIVHSDHGPGSRLDWKSLPDTDLKERFGILMAAHLPGNPAVDLGDEFSPVNVFRLLFDAYFGAAMGPLEHRSYYTFQSQPFRYIDVTDPDHPREVDAR